MEFQVFRDERPKRYVIDLKVGEAGEHCGTTYARISEDTGLVVGQSVYAVKKPSDYKDTRVELVPKGTSIVITF
mgnify:CR=1 FL=1